MASQKQTDKFVLVMVPPGGTAISSYLIGKSTERPGFTLRLEQPARIVEVPCQAGGSECHFDQIPMVSILTSLDVNLDTAIGHRELDPDLKHDAAVIKAYEQLVEQVRAKQSGLVSV